MFTGCRVSQPWQPGTDYVYGLQGVSALATWTCPCLQAAGCLSPGNLELTMFTGCRVPQPWQPGTDNVYRLQGASALPTWN